MPPVEPPVPIPGARLLFSLDAGTAHLNHGSFGAAPIPVQRTQQRMRDEMEADPVRFFAHGLLDRLRHTRRHLCAFVRADRNGTALVTNATAGVSLVLRALRLSAGDEVITTNHGYGAVALAVERTCRSVGAVRRQVDLPLAPTDDEVRAGIDEIMTRRTRLVVLDQITSPTARLFPVASVVASARAWGAAVLVDAAHVPGQLPVDVEEIGADFWVGNLHKWAFAPRGTALLAVGPQWRERIRPATVSWEQPNGFPGSVEFHGTDDYTGWLAAPAGVFTLRTLGVDAVRRHNTELAAYGQAVVGAALGLDPAQLPSPPPATPLAMRVVPLPAGIAVDTPAAVALRARIASELGAQVAVSGWCGRGLLRLSAQVYNRAEEYERLAHGLPRLLAASA